MEVRRMNLPDVIVHCRVGNKCLLAKLTLLGDWDKVGFYVSREKHFRMINGAAIFAVISRGMLHFVSSFLVAVQVLIGIKR